MYYLLINTSTFSCKYIKNLMYSITKVTQLLQASYIEHLLCIIFKRAIQAVILITAQQYELSYTYTTAHIVLGPPTLQVTLVQKKTNKKKATSLFVSLYHYLLLLHQ
ncbi:hypothetical protein OTU49_010883 [Cherax quadricarinatus]|uniref:Uncharacterized protein n=1 Tax=Cherax quadricarinatus TaxID=27406 RepID=A0AAW0WDZ3_CHEQU